MNVNFFVDFSSPLVVALAIAGGVVLYGLLAAIVGGVTYRLTDEDVGVSLIIGLLWPVSLPLCMVVGFLLFISLPFVWLAIWIGGGER